MFKKRNNRAGNTVFVDWNLVEGTLIRGYEIYQALNHPFIDGNGRVARIMMNAELVAAGQAKILIPIVYRDDYLENCNAFQESTEASLKF